MTAKTYLSQITAVALLAVAAVAQEPAVKTNKSADQQRIAAAASGFAPNSGKQAVIDRLKALFSTSSRPIISTKKFEPLPPYMHVTQIPATKLTP
ncbi:MAG: hypothetical protein E7040_07770, partial [Lentisphaerae bacterium]|nr:hypothetical protein [Lentisphaerota bacterium]